MSATGGSVESLSLDGRSFPVAADADVQIKHGGFENDVQANGNATARQVKTRVPWSISDAQVEIDNDRGDQEFLQNLADGNINFPVVVTLADGNSYNGTGTITGEMAMSTQNATASLSLMGPDKLTKQT